MGFIGIHLNILLLKWSCTSIMLLFLIFSKYCNKISFFLKVFLVAMCQNTNLSNFMSVQTPCCLQYQGHRQCHMTHKVLIIC